MSVAVIVVSGIALIVLTFVAGRFSVMNPNSQTGRRFVRPAQGTVTTYNEDPPALCIRTDDEESICGQLRLEEDLGILERGERVRGFYVAAPYDSAGEGAYLVWVSIFRL